MEQLTLFYKTLKELNKKIDGIDNAQAFLNAIVNSENDKDSLEAERTYCKIDEKWIEKIEQELVYVAKAIEEDRQFIIQNGEVVNIEKIKKVSKASVRHLAKHSSLITRLPEKEGEIQPEKLYMVENLTDYAIYENRFLYMLLCYLRDFMAIRISEINDVGNTYVSRMVVKKDITIKKRHFVYSIDLYDKDKNDRFSHLFSDAQPMLQRINDQYSNVLSLLNTPLMKEVSKAPMIKPPITKTNVLKMNNNFIHAMELYHYISSYQGKGYTVEKIKNSFTPIPKPIMQEYGAIISLSAFLAYKYGNKFWQMIEDACIKEDKEIEEQEKAKLREQVLALKNKLDGSNEKYLEYALKLEERNKSLEYVYDSLQKIKEELALSHQREDQLNKRIAQLEKDLAYQREIADENMRKFREKDFEYQDKVIAVDQLKIKCQSEFDQKMANLQQQIDMEVNKLRQSIQEESARQMDAFKSQVESDSKIDKENAMAEYTKDFNERERQLNYELAQIKNQLDGKIQEFNRLKDEYNKNTAQLVGLRTQHGLSAPLDDYTSEERFIELEEQFEFFASFFKAQWEKTKKRIRKEILWKEKAEGKNKKD